jgi:hypothetical protein
MKWAIVLSTIIFTAGIVFSTTLLVEALKSPDLDIKGISENIEKISAGMDALRKDMKPTQVYVTNMPDPTRMFSPKNITKEIEKQLR